MKLFLKQVVDIMLQSAFPGLQLGAASEQQDGAKKKERLESYVAFGLNRIILQVHFFSGSIEFITVFLSGKQGRFTVFFTLTVCGDVTDRLDGESMAGFRVGPAAAFVGGYFFQGLLYALLIRLVHVGADDAANNTAHYCSRNHCSDLRALVFVLGK